jgi:hypothetical protein
MLVATLVTLVIVPVLYVIFVEDLHLVRWEAETVNHEAKSQPAPGGDSKAPPLKPAENSNDRHAEQAPQMN